MKIRIILSGLGGELDRQTIECSNGQFGPHGEHNAACDVSSAIYQAMNAWILAPGDTIKIEEVER